MNHLLHWALSLFFVAHAWAVDPMFKLQWGLSNQGQILYREAAEIRNLEIVGTPGVDIRSPGLEELSQMAPDREVIVAVIDYGIDLTHPEFKGRVLPGKDFLEGKSVADDGGHGTHVAGIIAANADGKGIQGVTPSQIKILPLKVLNKSVEGYIYKNKYITDIIADAIAHAIESKASVINMSVGWPQQIHTPRIIKALDSAIAKGIVIVAAAGNNNKDAPVWPCIHPGVICVGAMDNQGKLAEYSNHGGKIDMIAPGEWIVSTIPLALESRTLRIKGYEAKNGSSQAAPFVSAAAALLRLQNPDISVNEIKARLYSTAMPLVEGADKKFVRFGSLSLKDALTKPLTSLASVSTKEIITIDVSKDGSYDFRLPIEVYGPSLSSPTVSMSGLKASLTVQDNSIRIQGKFDDLNVDSEVPVEFKITLDGNTTRQQTSLSFARKIESHDMISVTFKGVPANAIISAQGANKKTSLIDVSVEGTASHDFHNYIYSKKEDLIRVLAFRANSDSTSMSTADIKLEGHNTLMSVIEKDVNFDGQNDLIFYGLNSKRTHIVLTFTSLSGVLLFGANSRWELPISTFEGLPLKGVMANFSWLRLKTFMGDVAVPYYQKPWLMPKEDNSTDILDFEPVSMANRFYYWEPYKEGDKVLVRPRVVDSVSFKQKLKTALTQTSWERVTVERILPQTNKEKAQGIVRHVVSVGENFFRRFFILTVRSPIDYQLVAHTDTDVYQVGNNPIVTRSLNDDRVTTNSFQMALLDRSSARIKPFIENEASQAWTLQTSGWTNPFFEVVGAYESEDRRILFFESRYFAYAYEQRQGAEPIARHLPIYRESSFPGVSFSETLQSVLVHDGQQNNPALMVNSKLIYGDRLYVMMSTEDSFIRPLALSVKFPSNCAALTSQRLSHSLNRSAYTMVCLGTSGEVNLSFFPLEITR